MHKVELLAPAGNAAALRAAVRAGADAVYVGLESFNARRGADNFTVGDLKEAASYAHLRGVRVYVALNTAVLPGEADEALECARQAYRAGADAFIVQDVGVAGELARALPEARLHVSTQMNVHNAAGVRAAARLGARRVTLARELSLPEVAALVRAAEEEGLEVETFAHGALCVCYSGQCFMSSLIGGRSANRGLCAQACRLPYELRNRALHKALPSPGDHLLSPQDLCAIDLVPALVEAGVASLKIEGRMKSPEYVQAVTAAYRAVLDRTLAAKDEGARASVHATAEERRSLEEAFSRGFTTAYLEGARGNDVMSYQRPNNRGAFVGRVADVRKGEALIAHERRLVEGDVLEFWTGKGHVAQTLGAPERDGSGHTRVPLDARAARSVRAGDRVFRVRSAEAAYVDDALAPRIPVEGTVAVRLGEPVRVTFAPAAPASVKGVEARIAARLEERLAGVRVEGAAEGCVVEAARTKAVDAADVRAHIDRLGSTPYRIVSLSVDVDEGVGIGFSQLHQVRAQALENLTCRLLASDGDRVLPRVSARPPRPPARPRGCRIAALATNPVCARAAKRSGADLVFVPALNYRRGEAVIAGQHSETAEQAGYPKQCLIALPVVEHDPAPPAREAVVGFDPWRSVGADRPVFVDSLGALQQAAERGLPFDVGPHVPVTNRLSLEQMADFGATRVWLSPELTLAQIKELAHEAPVELGLFVIGAQELMVTEHCLLMSQGPCDERCDACARRKSPHYLRDRKDFEFPVITDALGRSHLYNSVALDVASALPELLAAGVSSFLVDTTLMNGEEAAQAVGRAKRALAVAQNDGNAVGKMPGTTTGHLFRGVQ